MSSISAGTTVGTALVSTGDTTGNLVIKTGANATTALTISGTDQSITVAGGLNLGAPVAVASGGTGANTAANARTNLGLVIGTDVLAPNGSGASLTSLNASSISAGTLSNDRLDTVSIAKGGTNNASLGVTAGGVVYSDGSKLVNTGAGTSGYYLQSNGSSAPTWTAVSTTPTTAQVLSATAGASVDAIGTYALMRTQGANLSPGDTYSGANLLHANAGAESSIVSSTGTWRCMGRSYAGEFATAWITLFLRIS